MTVVDCSFAIPSNLLSNLRFIPAVIMSSINFVWYLFFNSLASLEAVSMFCTDDTLITSQSVFYKGFNEPIKACILQSSMNSFTFAPFVHLRCLFIGSINDFIFMANLVERH